MARLEVECFLGVTEQGASETITDDTTIEGNTVDGELWGGYADNYADARNATTAWYKYDISQYMEFGQSLYNNIYDVIRGFLYFDTSDIPEDADIISANLTMTPYSIDGNFDIIIQSGMPDYPSIPLSVDDFDRSFYSGDGGENKNTSELVVGTAFTIALNEQGRSWINKGGMTKFCLRSSKDVDGIAPTDWEAVGVYTSERTTENQRPNLFVQYEYEGQKYTHNSIDGSLLVQMNPDYYPGLYIPGEADIVRITAGAVTDTSQGIRMKITVAGEDVTYYLIGNVHIAHNLNYISSFNFILGHPDYSPLTNSNIDIDSVVVITAYINGVEIKVFTGLVDNIQTINTTKGYKVEISGRDYGKKLLNTTKTLISVNEKARGRRGSIVRFLAGQAGVTNTQIPTGDSVGIDHSFQDQTIWDMIQKECAIEGWYVRFDENGKMICKTRQLKTTPDWIYGEDRFVQLGLFNTDEGIINWVIILGAIFEDVELIQETETVQTITTIPTETTSYDTITTSNSYSEGQISIGGWSGSGLTVSVSYVGMALGFSYQKYRFSVSGATNVVGYEWYSSALINSGHNSSTCEIWRKTNHGLGIPAKGFSVSITVRTKTATGGTEQVIEENENEIFREEITYEQVKAMVSDPISIATYGVRKPNNEGTLNFPLAETEQQCRRVGENIIKDSHRFIKQPDFLIPFNPKLIVGHTVELTDKKIGYDEDKYLVEEVIHDIDIPKDGKIKARTRIGCVFYA